MFIILHVYSDIVHYKHLNLFCKQKMFVKQLFDRSQFHTFFIQIRMNHIALWKLNNSLSKDVGIKFGANEIK